MLVSQTLTAELEKAQAEAVAASRPLALAVVNIDLFRRFNNRFGHAKGDHVLRFVASHLAKRLETDGGFVGVMPATAAATHRSNTCQSDRPNAAERLGRQQHGPHQLSAGADKHHAGQGLDQLFERADGALYTTKRLRRDRVAPDRG